MYLHTLVQLESTIMCFPERMGSKVSAGSLRVLVPHWDPVEEIAAGTRD
jgi:hypothetical protein